MKKVERRASALYVLIAITVICLAVFLYKYFSSGKNWALQAFNSSVYNDGILTSGNIYDRNGTLLSGTDGTYRWYADSEDIRESTLHVVGDQYGYIGTGVLHAFSSELAGYDIINGTYSMKNDGMDMYLTIDSSLNKAAYNALDGRKGTVAVCNYKTGEIICMVSSPSYDPQDGVDTEEEQYEGVYINRFLQAAYTPGSVFKLITTAAAIENIDDLFDRTFTCDGSLTLDGGEITCSSAHGEMKIEDALAVSCNCVYAQLAQELGADKLEKYAKMYGFTDPADVDGIVTECGAFEKGESGSADLGWSGAGQYDDLVNPAAMLKFVSAIANDGSAPKLHIINKIKNPIGLSVSGYPKKGSSELIDKSTARKLDSMMSYNTAKTYGNDNFPGLELHAKSGTAEVGDDVEPHSWFAGYITNDDYPLAFVVVVENGGSGSYTAGGVANSVLQEAISN